MSRWRIEAWREGEEDPFHSTVEFAERIPQAEPFVQSFLSTHMQILTEDERCARIEIRREP